MEQNFLHLINAAVSHELRNPLSSIIGQVIEMNEIMKKLKPLITPNYVTAYNGLLDIGLKITSASKFLDFFVHDILDYSMLNKEQVNFNKNIENFDIRLVVDEILQIHNDKVKMM